MDFTPRLTYTRKEKGESKSRGKKRLLNARFRYQKGKVRKSTLSWENLAIFLASFCGISPSSFLTSQS